MIEKSGKILKTTKKSGIFLSVITRNKGEYIILMLKIPKVREFFHLERVATLLAVCRDDLESDEYEETKNETIEQMKEFNESLNRMKEGDLSLVDELNRIQLVSKSLLKYIKF